MTIDKGTYISKAKSLYGRMLEAIRYYTGGKVDYDYYYGEQCVDYARAYANSIGHPIGTFGGSAYTGWVKGYPFINTFWKRRLYENGLVAPKGSIVFFAPTSYNPYGHVAVVIQATQNVLIVSEQNAGRGSGTGEGSDAVTTRIYKYRGSYIGNVVGWYYLN